MNLGLRWDRLGFPSFHSVPASNFLFTYGSQTPQITVPSSTSDCGCIQNNKNFAPRIGLAYQVSKNWVVRSGFGIFYGASNIADQDGERFADNPPALLGIQFPDRSSRQPGAHRRQRLPFRLDSDHAGAAELHVSKARRSSCRRNTPLQWFSDMQYSLPFGFVVTGSYIGVGTRNIPYAINYNTPLTPGAAVIQTRRPWPYYGTINYYPSGANMDYNAFTGKAEKRYTRSLTTLISYTWSHNLGTGTGQLNDSSQTFRDPYNLALDRGNAAYDLRQTLVGSFVYDLPFGHGRTWLRVTGPLDWILPAAGRCPAFSLSIPAAVSARPSPPTY